MDSSARHHLTVEEVPIAPHVPSVVQPRLFGQLPPAGQPLYQPTPQVVKQSDGSGFTFAQLKFIFPALIVVAVIAAAGYYLPKYLKGLNSAPPAAPEPSLVPATPVPTPDISPRTKKYLDLDKEITFDYLSSFTLVECENKITFLLTRPEDPADICTEEHSGVLEILIAADGLTLPFEGFENALNKSVEGNENNYLIVLLDQKYEQLFNKISETVSFINPDFTVNWDEYRSTAGYRISYPPEWTLISAEERGGSNVSEIRKNVTETKLHNLAIKMTDNVSNAGLSASEIITSLQGLSGWVERPNVEFRVIGGEVAHILQGEYEGVWKVNVVVWRGTSLVEMTWQDQLGQPENTTFEGLLSTFSFAR